LLLSGINENKWFGDSGAADDIVPIAHDS
jgi:hypothetical protein